MTLTQQEQARLAEGVRIKVDDKVVRVDHAGIDVNNEPYIEVILNGAVVRLPRDSDRLSKASEEETVADRQKALDQQGPMNDDSVSK